MSRPQTTFDNSKVCTFLQPYYLPSELCADHPPINDIFVGVLSAKTEGDTSVRTLSRQTLFHILAQCPQIDTASVERVTHGRMAARTARAYASLARTASRFIGSFIDRLPPEALS